MSAYGGPPRLYIHLSPMKHRKQGLMAPQYACLCALDSCWEIVNVHHPGYLNNEHSKYAIHQIYTVNSYLNTLSRLRVQGTRLDTAPTC